MRGSGVDVGGAGVGVGSGVPVGKGLSATVDVVGRIPVPDGVSLDT